MRIWICLDGFTTHFTTNTTNTTNTTSSTTQPHRIPTTTCAMKFSPCLFLHGFCSGLQHAERNRCSGLCWPRLFPEVGWYGKTCLNSLLNVVVESAVRYVWMVSSLTSPPTPPTPHNTTQPHRIPTCAKKFSPCLFLHGFCSGLQHAERNRYSRLFWPSLSRGWLVR